jgi:hypothetical protein
MLKGIQSNEFGIDPYLSLSDAPTFFRELSQKYALESEPSSSQREVRMLINTTLQRDKSSII